LSSLEETGRQFNGGKCAIKFAEGRIRPVCGLGIDVHQGFYVVVEQVEGANPKPAQRFGKQAFLHWAAKVKNQAREVHAVYEACGFGFSLQRQLAALGIDCHVVSPQKLDEQNKRVKTDGLDAKALCLKLDRFVQGNRDALAVVRVPTEQEEHSRAIHRLREQLVSARKRLEAQGRSLMVNHGVEPVQNWWKPRTFAALAVAQWMRELLGKSQPLLLALQERIAALTLQLQSVAAPNQPRGLGKMTSVIIDREIGDWHRFNNRRQIASYTGLCPGEYSSGNTRLQSCVTKHGNPRLQSCLGGVGLETGPLPTQLQASGQMAADPRARHPCHRSGTQKSNRSCGSPTGCRSVENQNRPAHCPAVGIKNLK
jgi:transposase